MLFISSACEKQFGAIEIVLPALSPHTLSRATATATAIANAKARRVAVAVAAFWRIFIWFQSRHIFHLYLQSDTINFELLKDIERKRDVEIGMEWNASNEWRATIEREREEKKRI